MSLLRCIPALAVAGGRPRGRETTSSGFFHWLTRTLHGAGDDTHSAELMAGLHPLPGRRGAERLVGLPPGVLTLPCCFRCGTQGPRSAETAGPLRGLDRRQGG